MHWKSHLLDTPNMSPWVNSTSISDKVPTVYFRNTPLFYKLYHTPSSRSFCLHIIHLMACEEMYVSHLCVSQYSLICQNSDINVLISAQARACVCVCFTLLF
jgi:hypothetical protein